MFEESILVYATGANKCGTRNTKCEIEKNKRSDKFLFMRAIASFSVCEVFAKAKVKLCYTQ